MGKIIIKDPLKKYNIKTGIFMNAIELYVSEKNIYNELCKSNNLYRIEISSEIKKWLSGVSIPGKKKTDKSKIKFCVQSWSKYLSSGARKEENKKTANIILTDLIQRTKDGSLIWEETIHSISSGMRKRCYATRLNNTTVYLNVSSYRNKDNETKTLILLQIENNQGQIITLPNHYNKVLYELVCKTAIVPKKTEDLKLIRRPIGSRKEIKINQGDFVVRTNLFRCFYKEHVIEEIIGLIKVVTPLGIEKEERVPCAYCWECSCFYMLLSEYERLSKKGILLCQLIDKEVYYNNGIPNNFKVSSESLLMQNGYNVKASNGLTDFQRQTILKNIIDNNILSPHRIVSYLDLFINQKKSIPQYKAAVEKWKKDRAYVLAYKENIKHAVKIEKIRR